MAKIEEMCIDFRKSKLYPFSVAPAPSMIKGKPVAEGQQCKYLGTVLDAKLDFDANTDAICTVERQTRSNSF